MEVRTQPSTVQCKDDKADRYSNSEADFRSLRIVKGVDHLIYISNTDTSIMFY